MRMAECYRKLGDQQAIKVFERVVREFGDQKQAADAARASLASVAATGPAATVNRQLWTGPDVDTMGTITADGRYLSFTDWNTGNLAIRDMSRGTWRPLTNKAGYDDDPRPGARFLAMAHRSPTPGTARKLTDTIFACSRLMPHQGQGRESCATTPM